MAGAATLLPQMQRDGAAIPDNLSTQPRLAQNLLGYLDAFYDLDTERSHVHGLVRIPWSKIVFYGRHYDMNVEELIFFIREMDDALLASMASKTPTGSTDGGSKGSRTAVQRPPRPD